MHGRLTLSDNRGFSMVELLVVILIIAILAMIALPAFTGQRTKAQDLNAQTTIRTVATALATYHTDHDSYDASRAQLTQIEPALSQATSALTVSGGDDRYTVTETSASGTDFTLRRTAGGGIERSCTVPSRGRCDGSGGW